MNTLNFSKQYQLLSLIFFCTSLFFASCDTEPKTDPTTIDDVAIATVTAPSVDSDSTKAHFFYAWLADCVNDSTLSAVSADSAQAKFQRTAAHRIRKSIKNTSIVNSLNLGTQELVFGPFVQVDTTVTSTWLSVNLIYILKSENDTEITFNIGVSGTNMISMFDWFSEDFPVEEQFNWNNDASNGKISKGSKEGFSILDNLTNSTGQNYLQFIQAQIASTSKTVSVNVSGHSLGGALTPLIALSIKEASPNTTVTAWTYAGPTPGNTAFANYIEGELEGRIFPYNNTLDVVPHAWDSTTLKQLCSIYDNVTPCNDFPFPIAGSVNSAVLGVIKYIREISKKGDYKVLGTPKTFKGNVGKISLEDCGILTSAVLLIIKEKFPKGIYDPIKTLETNCALSNTDINVEDVILFTDFFLYMAELGTQHTTGYFNQFITDPNAKVAVNKYVPGAKFKSSELVNASIGFPILERFLGGAAAKINKKMDCSCAE